MVTDEENSIIERMIEEGKNAIAIRAAVPDVSRTNVYLKIAKFKKHGTVGRVQTKTLGRPRVMSEGVDKFLQGLLAAKPDMELEEMRRHIQDQLRVTVSMSTISRAITRAGMANGRPGRARLSARRKNKAVAAAEAGGVVAENHQSSAPTSDLVEPNDHVAAIDEPTWDQMEQSTLPAHHFQPNLNQQPQHVMMQMSHHQVQPQEMHVLDPSLAQAYQVPAPYHSIYADMSRAMTHTAGMAHTALGVNTGLTPNMEAYRSPYAPI